MARRYGREIDGIVVVDKPAGMTSRRVVDKVQAITKAKKAGHAGTLDPDATGVLLVCLGRATKLFDRLSQHAKEYVGTVRLGIETDTQDASGEVLRVSDKMPTEEELNAVIPEFIGEIKQVPPMYSAVRVGGTRLYKLARKGWEIERPKRQVTIHELEVLHFDPPFIEIRVLCSKGTYIRTLAADIGERLGCGAHLCELVRTRSGPFTVEMACSLDEMESDSDDGLDFVLSMEEVIEMIESETLL